MTPRERIQAAIRYQPSQQLPVHDHLWQQVPELWREQGMRSDADPADVFGFDVSEMFLDTSPRFEQEILARDDGYITFRDRFGYTCRKLEGNSGTIEFTDHYTEDHDAWKNLRRRMQHAKVDEDPARLDDASYFAHFEAYPTWEQAARKYHCIRQSNRYVLFVAYGPWEATWRHRGFDKLLMDLAADGQWVREMSDVYMDLLIRTLQSCLDRGLRPDGLLLIEDLGSNHGLLFSPDMWNERLGPAMRSLGAKLSEERVDFWMHSCGGVVELYDPLIDCGVQVMNPLQVTAGLDIEELQSRYANRLAFWGNVSAAAMSGPLEELREDIQRKARLARNGGYIFGSDHSVPPDVSYDRYCWILQTARQAFAKSQ